LVAIGALTEVTDTVEIYQALPTVVDAIEARENIEINGMGY